MCSPNHIHSFLPYFLPSFHSKSTASKHPDLKTLSRRNPFSLEQHSPVLLATQSAIYSTPTKQIQTHACQCQLIWLMKLSRHGLGRLVAWLPNRRSRGRLPFTIATLDAALVRAFT